MAMWLCKPVSTLDLVIVCWAPNHYLIPKFTNKTNLNKYYCHLIKTHLHIIKMINILSRDQWIHANICHLANQAMVTFVQWFFHSLFKRYGNNNLLCNGSQWIQMMYLPILFRVYLDSSDGGGVGVDNKPDSSSSLYLYEIALINSII